MVLPRSLRYSRFLFRPLDPDDADALVATGECRTHAEACAQIAMYASGFVTGAQVNYGVFTVEGELVGCGSLTPTTDARAVNIGIWLAAGRRGAGIGTDVVTALTEIAVRWLGAERMEIWCEPTNAAMAAVARKVGFAHVATLDDWHLNDRGERVAHMLWRADAAQWAGADVREVACVRAPEMAPLWKHLQMHYRVLESDQQVCHLALEVGLEGRRVWQLVTVEQCAIGDRPWLVLRALIGPRMLLSESDALQHNTLLAVGAIALEHGHYVLRHGLDPTTPFAGVDYIALLLADEAARLTQQLRVTAADHGTAFSAFAD